MFWREKHTRVFLKELLCIACLGITAALLFLRLQESRVQSLLHEHDAAVISFLLGQGVSEQTAAKTIVYARDYAEEAAELERGEILLARMGMTENVDIRLMPALCKYCDAERAAVLLGGILFSLLLFLCVFRYLQKRERIYREAIAAIENCAEEDFSLRLPELYDGTLYQLFSRINFMAAMLKTRRETENKIKEFLKMTVSDISHQLKTPLAALSMYLEVIRDEAEQVDTVALFAEKSEAALARMEGLIQTLLTLTRLDAGSVVFVKRFFDAKELVLEAAEELTDRAEKEKKEIVLSGDDNATVYCDPDWSREALGNLIKNALDHTEEGDEISITWEQTPLITRFIVTDTGEGIEEEDIHHIFKRFYRSKNARGRQGTGLGLSLVKSIADGQGGTVSVQSEAQGETTFILAFPNEGKGQVSGADI